MRVLVFPYPVSLNFLALIEGSISVSLIYISLINNGVEYLFICLFFILIPSLEKYLFISLTYFKIVFLFLSFESSLYSRHKFSVIYNALQMFSLVSGLLS
jgi:hypothetical protein